MRYKLMPMLAMALLAWFGTSPAGAQQPGSITGRIADVETGAPLSSARVEAVSTSGRTAASAFSGEDGQFRLSGLPPGTYALVFTMVGYESQRIENVRVVPGETSIIGAQLVSAAFALNPVVVSASRRQEKALDAPASVSVVSTQEIAERPALTPIDHLRSTPGTDIITYGLQSTTVVARGFNNIFSGAMHALTDNRIASVPSLRVNFMHFIPTNNEDLERIEVVLGPGSALYGPNTANGVLHLITKSPLDHQGTVLTVGGGQQSVFQGEFRTAHLVGENLGIKLSGQYVTGEEYVYTDPIEQAARATADRNPDSLRLVLRSQGVSDAEISDRLRRIGIRDFDLTRWGFEARADWRVTPELTTYLSFGNTVAAKGIEQTGIGAAQAVDWIYRYYHARANYKGLFGQVYLNTSNAGDTYLLRDGASIVDDSKLLVAQLQHAVSMGDRQAFTYGGDYLRTVPETRRTIHGRNEDDDIITEYGAYVQSETNLSPQFDLVLAGRVDTHSHIDQAVFSPRAALVFKPVENHVIRGTYNRAFSTPTAVNLFLDIHGGPAPSAALARLGYGLRAQGTGKSGISLHNQDGSLSMRSPFTPAQAGGPTSLIPAHPDALAQYWVAAVSVLEAAAAASGTPLPPTLVAYMKSLMPTGSDLGMSGLDLNTQQRIAVSAQSVSDVPGVRESITTTFELGYKGLIGDRLLLAADVWASDRKNFTSPLMAQTPLVLYDGQQLGTYLVPRLLAVGVPEQQAQLIAAGLASIPLGVVSSEAVNATGADVLVSYRNFGSVSLYGADLAATALLSDRWTLGLMASYVSDDHFRTDGQLVALNAPKRKGSVSVAYRNPAAGVNGEVRVRHTSEFPVNSAPYIGVGCVLPGPGAGECVKDHTLVDLTLGYRLPLARTTMLQVTVQNLFDQAYQSFLGVPEIGRFALLRLRYEF